MDLVIQDRESLENVELNLYFLIEVHAMGQRQSLAGSSVYCENISFFLHLPINSTSFPVQIY